MRSDRESPLVLSARSNALQFYDARQKLAIAKQAVGLSTSSSASLRSSSYYYSSASASASSSLRANVDEDDLPMSGQRQQFYELLVSPSSVRDHSEQHLQSKSNILNNVHLDANSLSSSSASSASLSSMSSPSAFSEFSPLSSSGPSKPSRAENSGSATTHTYRSLIPNSLPSGPHFSRDSVLREHNYELPFAPSSPPTSGKLILSSSSRRRSSSSSVSASNNNGIGSDTSAAIRAILDAADEERLGKSAVTSKQKTGSVSKHRRDSQPHLESRYKHYQMPYSEKVSGSTSSKTLASNNNAEYRIDPPRSSSASVHSLARSFHSRSSVERHQWDKKEAALDTLPLEILDQICLYLPQQTLLAMVQSSRYLASSAYVYLYMDPQFTSSYRFAQFVSVISHDSTLASYVKTLDLSKIGARVKGDTVLAGWRDWKYRSEPLYSTRGRTSSHKTSLPHSYKFHEHSVERREARKVATSSAALQCGVISLHPLQSPLLKQYTLSRDAPAGAIIHVLRACPHLKKIDISYLPLAADYRVLSRTAFQPTAFTGELFVSDVPKLYNWSDSETKSVNVGKDLIDAILALTELEVLRLRKLVWVSKQIADRICRDAASKNCLSVVDLRECGMTRDVSWAISGDLRDLHRALDD